MNLKPLEDRIVVRPNESEETTASGIVIPDTAKEKPQQGEVLAVGPGRRSEQSGEIIPLDIKVGDTVVYSKYGGTEYVLDGESAWTGKHRGQLRQTLDDARGFSSRLRNASCGRLPCWPLTCCFPGKSAPICWSRSRDQSHLDCEVACC